MDPARLQTALLVFAVVALLGIGMVILTRVRKMVHQPEAEPENLLESLQQAFEDGEMDEAEYRRVREVLEKKSGEKGLLPGEPQVPRF